ncbi:MAG: long-chain fatty acid--CoA ligase [Gemmatimonadetes bacterium]|nr:long-chain fatty acid--CoA ligase [Gemmatimonadota bacterium]
MHLSQQHESSAGVERFDQLASGLEASFSAGVADPWTDDEFSSAAMKVFRYQFEHNSTYRRFCEGRDRGPDSVQDWVDVPAVPTRAFRHLDLVCGDPSQAEAVFRTSGTTGDGGPRGRHLVPRLSLYDASLLPAFKAYLLPDLDRINFVSLIPPPTALPDSSLSHMVGAAAQRYATEATWAVDGSGAIDAQALGNAIAAARASHAPVLLLGTAFAFVHALEAPAATLGPLPDGSRIMETGGFKGRARELPRDELYARLAAATGVSAARIVNEYGMTELQSQLYEPVLAGEPFGCGHVPPPWLRVRALDPTTLEGQPEGESGILSFFDLANSGSVAHVLTEDLGAVSEGRVFLAGRAADAEPRGCSRAMDDLMTAAGFR